MGKYLKKSPFWFFAVFLLFTLIATVVAAQEIAPTPKVDTGDTAWLLTSAALVLLMTPALAFFYGGLVRKKNILSVLMQCFMITCLITIQWVLFGYSLAFGPDVKGVIGSLAWFGLKGVGLDPNPAYAATVPHQAFMIFQAMFAIITPALILGAFAERMKFSTFCIFSLLWATLVYDPVCHWVWGVGGFLRADGALDFAGGTVVHINAGVAALACALVLGKRKGYPDKISPPHNLPFAVLGAGLLWFGWFGFNGGSALGSGSLATSAFVVTHIAAAAAGLTWALLDWIINSRSTVLGIITGSVAGLVAITPASGFVNPIGAIWIGIGVSVFCYMAVAILKVKFGYDDSLDAFGVHGIGGMWGALATGLWATKAVNSAGANGLFYGNPAQFLIQFKAVIVTAVYSFVMTFVILKVLNAVMGVRASEQDERIGLDLTQHREAGYTVLE
ncbi:MAG: ammonia channel protein [Omnitrophica WOR_2 bacterium RIFCSPLOWO2_12_FULL_51_24]|nr:MAG: ammonia channel protein [Omnitrophica WOR_2 bacterium RIFCSPLOWO2_02_FULL_50_19]OGX43218.1 MAG: ammonia channel protein [Omnitrophica WOR_2 bacterium RIFCSPLOWO2_12_FULL_51_24]